MYALLCNAHAFPVGSTTTAHASTYWGCQSKLESCNLPRGAARAGVAPSSVPCPVAALMVASLGVLVQMGTCSP